MTQALQGRATAQSLAPAVGAAHGLP